jgi:hypothetical protein
MRIRVVPITASPPSLKLLGYMSIRVYVAFATTVGNQAWIIRMMSQVESMKVSQRRQDHRIVVRTPLSKGSAQASTASRLFLPSIGADH